MQTALHFPVSLMRQVCRSLDLPESGDVFVCNSGAFRFEALAGKTRPGLHLHSADPSLYSSVVGYLARNKSLPFRFTGRMEFAEQQLADASPLVRTAAVLVAHDMGKFVANNDYCRKHWAWYEDNFPACLEKAAAKISGLLSDLHLGEYTARDFKEQAAAAVASGAFVAAFPPLQKGSIKSAYKFLDGVTEWQQPALGDYEPAQLDGLVAEWEQAGNGYALITDQTWEHRKPKVVFKAGRTKTFYGYFEAGRTAVRASVGVAKPFKYEPVDVSKLRPETLVQIVPVPIGAVNALRNVYLAKGIHMSQSSFRNYLVLLDGMLAGGIMYDQSKFGVPDEIYLLSDFSVTRQGKISKLIATLATSRFIIAHMEKAMMRRIQTIFTTVFTENAASMKYRGVFEVSGRNVSKHGDGKYINYSSGVREKSPDELYREWYDANHGTKQPKQRSRSRERNRGGNTDAG